MRLGPYATEATLRAVVLGGDTGRDGVCPGGVSIVMRRWAGLLP
jgi:hypothetical protein